MLQLYALLFAFLLQEICGSARHYLIFFWRGVGGCGGGSPAAPTATPANFLQQKRKAHGGSIIVDEFTFTTTENRTRVSPVRGEHSTDRPRPQEMTFDIIAGIRWHNLSKIMLKYNGESPVQRAGRPAGLPAGRKPGHGNDSRGVVDKFRQICLVCIFQICLVCLVYW
jgi:hypothetical protein